MKNYTSILLIIILFASCVQYEKIGTYNYKIKVKQSFTGDYGGIVKTIKSYNYNKKHQAGVVIQSKIGFENTSDSIYSTGYSFIDNSNKELIAKEYYYFGYSKYLSADSIIKIFKQLDNGELKLLNFSQYYNGRIYRSFKDSI